MKTKPTTKTKRTAARLPSAEAAVQQPRAGIVPRKSGDASMKKALAGGTAPAPIQGSVRLDIANATPAVIMALTLKIKDALTDNIYYEELVSILAALRASYTGQSSLAALIATLEAQLKTARLAQVTETMNGRDILKSAARACESYDSSDEALVSGGWDLKKPRTPSQILPAPAKLKLRATVFPGVMTAIWSRVQNFRFYDYQIFVTSDPAVSPDWSTLPIGNNTVTQITTEAHPVGSLMYFRVRTVSSKGPGPWGDTLTGLVL